MCLNVVTVKDEVFPSRKVSSPPHMLVAVERGCWKVGWRSSRSLAALKVLERTSRKTNQ